MGGNYRVVLPMPMDRNPGPGPEETRSRVEGHRDQWEALGEILVLQALVLEVDLREEILLQEVVQGLEESRRS